jgi:hypothetical protein
MLLDTAIGYRAFTFFTLRTAGIADTANLRLMTFAEDKRKLAHSAVVSVDGTG